MDEVAAGEVVVLERNGRRIVLSSEDRETAESSEAMPDYSALIKASGVDHAEKWSWQWLGPERGLGLRDDPHT